MAEPIKTVLPVAGLGTRFLPATKSIPKEMLPVVDKPLIQYAAEEAIAAGCRSLVFVTNRTKHAIADHFDTAFELEQHLAAAGRRRALERVRDVLPRNVDCQFVLQTRALGLGHAVLCARPAVGREAFAVILPDDLIRSEGDGCLAQLLAVHRRTGHSVIGVQVVPEDQVHRYGVVAPESNENPVRIRDVVEKPEAREAPSNLAVVGRYILTPRIFDLLESQSAGAGDEIQLTDAIARLLEHEPVHALQFEGVRYDCGHKAGYVRAVVDCALEQEDLRADLLAFLRKRLEREQIS